MGVGKAPHGPRLRRPLPYVDVKRAHWQLLALVVTAALAGCDGNFTVTRFLDVDRLETTLTEGLEEQTGVAIESVECPEEVPMEAGNEFECIATDDQGNTGTIIVTQDDDEGNITWVLE
jgi:Domain of unknown function (DUF4333)